MDIEQWVKQQVAEARAAGALGSKSEFKKRLISQRPQQKLEIRQLINKIKWGDAIPSKKTLSTATIAQAAKVKATSLSSSQASSAKQSSQFSRSSDQTSETSRQSLDEILKSVVSLDPNTRNTKIQDLHTSLSDVSPKRNAGTSKVELPPLDHQWELLHRNIPLRSRGPESCSLETATLFSAEAFSKGLAHQAPQFALLGSQVPHVRTHGTQTIDERMFLNTNIPFSAFVCGLQGSGKSHTTSCIIENCMIKSDKLGVLEAPSSTLVLHYGEHSTSQNFRPSEFAFLSNLDRTVSSNARRLPVKIFVSISSFLILKARYTEIPGVIVHPFLIDPKELTTETMLTLMAVSKTGSPPLYISQVTNILRQMASESSQGFCYRTFRQRLRDTHFDRLQEEHLNQRLDLLESFVDLSGKAVAPGYAPGEVTIIDLSCPFVDENTACLLFNVGISRFLASSSSRGKLLVIDEAHKFMHDTPAAKQLTESLLSMIRQQRHYGLRIVVSTQEPYVSPRIIELCSIIVIHRFSSPAWFETLRKHISAESGNAEELFREISDLQTGEAIIFAPSAVLKLEDGKLSKAGGKTLRVLIRRRITWDSGKSVLSV